MVENQKDKTTHVINSKIGVYGDHVTVHGGVHLYHSDPKKDSADNSGENKTQEKRVVFDPANAVNILHLSDLHFGADKQSDPLSDASRWCGQLIDDLCEELMCKQLDAVIISGDIGNVSEPSEYEAAQLFLECLCKRFRLSASNIVIVPGNHDLNWKDSKKGYRLVDKEDYDEPCKEGHFIRVSDDVIRLRDDDVYPMRFQKFSGFYENIFGTPYPLDSKKQATLHHFSELNLLVVGFNSSWDADHHFKTRISINPDSVQFVLNQIRDQDVYQNCLKLAVWHHPLVSEGDDRIRDHAFLQRLAQADFHVCLHGHIHKSDTGLFRYDMAPGGRKIDIVGAGTFGSPVEEWVPGYPLQYNLLRLSQNILRVYTRCRKEPNGTWGPDHLWRQGKGKDNLPYYDIVFSGSTKPKPEEPRPQEPAPEIFDPPSDPELETEIKAYRIKVESLHNSLPVAGFATHLKVPINIEDIYIPLRAMVNLKGVDDIQCYYDSSEAEKHLTRCDAGMEISLLDAFEQAEKRGRKGLVILGDPGSGKTTHMKRMLLWCLRKGPETMGLPTGMLPIFLPLREIKQLEQGLDHFIQDQLTSRHFKMRPDFGERMMKRGNLLFLLDGLDEVADLAQREKVSDWIEEAFDYYPDCRFVVTCRFAGYSPSVRLSEKFLEMHVRPLSEQEAEKFVRNWYGIVEKSLAKDMEQAESIAQEKADHLIERLSQPDFRARRVFELTRNPLLLTNICLVHRHRGSLPQRRARLYEECIDVLLEHWRESKKLMVGVSALQGRQVLQPAALWLHKEEGRTRATADELSPVIEPALKEIQWVGGDAHKFLEIIRDESGLLTGWDQEHYGFMHLGFQEYLAARQIRSLFQQEMNEAGQSNMLKELAQHFGESWWQEVALLLLALEDPPLFVPYMRYVVQHPSFAKNADLVEMCLDDAIKPSAQPFVELLKVKPGKDQNLWERQLLALKIAERLEEKFLEAIWDQIREHPYEPIRQWIQERFKQAQQDVIWPEPSGYELLLIKGGSFMMGSEEYDTEKPVHEVTVPDFYMGRYPVTNEEYGRFIEATGYKEPDYWGDREYNQPRQPVVGVSWHDAKAFARWAGLQLPSEAQWEYACRAETTTRYYTGDSEDDLDRAGWYSKNSGNKLHPVGEKEPNAFGLYDMHGNVWEWCEDHWHDNYDKAPVDGSAWVDRDEGSYRVIRGGWWDVGAVNCWAAYRDWGDPDGRISYYGFRLVRLPAHRARWMPAC